MLFLCPTEGDIIMNTDKQIEFDKVKEIWADLAITDLAKEKIREASLYLSENELRKQLRDTTDARNMIEKLGTPPLQNISEIKDILLIAEKGDCLTPYQLERVEKGLVAIKRLRDYLEKGKIYNYSKRNINLRYPAALLTSLLRAALFLLSRQA